MSRENDPFFPESAKTAMSEEETAVDFEQVRKWRDMPAYRAMMGCSPRDFHALCDLIRSGLRDEVNMQSTFWVVARLFKFFFKRLDPAIKLHLVRLQLDHLVLQFRVARLQFGNVLADYRISLLELRLKVRRHGPLPVLVAYLKQRSRK